MSRISITLNLNRDESLLRHPETTNGIRKNPTNSTIGHRLRDATRGSRNDRFRPRSIVRSNNGNPGEGFGFEPVARSCHETFRRGHEARRTRRRDTIARAPAASALKTYVEGSGTGIESQKAMLSTAPAKRPLAGCSLRI